MNRVPALFALVTCLAVPAGSGEPRADASTSGLGALGHALERRDPAALADTTLPRLASLDSIGRAWLARRIESWDIGSRVAAYAFLQVGVPYRLGPLGEGAPPDTDPVIEFETTDCAVLNLVSAALAHVRDAGAERRAMAIAKVAGAACRERSVALNRRAGGGRWIPIDWSREREVFFAPRALGARFARWYDQGRIPAAMGIAFVEEPKLADGLDVVHESLLWKGHTILHASSRAGRVVTMPWSEFLAGPGRRYDGFVLFEYR